MRVSEHLAGHKERSTYTVLQRLGCCNSSTREKDRYIATDIEAISPSEAAIAVEPIHAKSVPQTNDV